MVKESLSSDIDLIKEFEQVKLKQKLLINSISQNNLTFQNQALDEINKKLDFLVTIFQKANENENDDHIEKKLEQIDKNQKENTNLLEEKIISYEEKFNLILEKLEVLQKENQENKALSNSLNKVESPLADLGNSSPNMNNSNLNSLSQIKPEIAPVQVDKSLSQNNDKSQILPPIPDFKVDDKKEKKKKWF